MKKTRLTELATSGVIILVVYVKTKHFINDIKTVTMKKPFILLVAMLLTSAGSFAQSNNSGILTGDVNGDGMVNVSDVTVLVSIILNGETNTETSNCFYLRTTQPMISSYNALLMGDVNGDGVVNVSDVTFLVSIILNGGTSTETYYFYLGTTPPTAANYRVLSGVETSYTSINDAFGTTAFVAAGETIYMLCPTAWITGNTVALEDNAGKTINFLDSVDTTTIPEYSIYQAPALNTSSSVKLKGQIILDYSKEYLTFEILGDGEIGWKTNSSTNVHAIEYNINNTGWFSITSSLSGSTISVNTGDKVSFRADNIAYGMGSSKNYFTSTCRFNVWGNIMSLIDKNDFASLTSLPVSYGFGYNFSDLFNNCVGLIDASNLMLPATTLSSYCYRGMFSGCTSLTAAPSLPAMLLAEHCYDSMFYKCTNLVSTPELPAIGLADYCYKYMFSGCSSLLYTPELPATTLGIQCYYCMFEGCSHLRTSPSMLPAETLTSNCYYMMFSGCSDLTSAPSLPALSLASHCYDNMFYKCVSLATAPELPATELADCCYYNMFYGCSNLGSAPKRLPATTLATSCYKYMFYGCTALKIAPELPAATLTSNCYDAMFSNYLI